MRTIRILVADDSEAVRESLPPLIELEDDMSVVGVATNGQDACDMASQLSPDIVLLDVVMPDMGGIDAAKRIKESDPETQIVMLSVYDRKNYIKNSKDAGASAYVIKGSPFEDLLITIRQVFQKKQTGMKAARE